MAVTFLTGFESVAAGLDQITLTGTAAYSTVQARTGTRSIRCNPASGAAGNITIPVGSFIHFGLYVAGLGSTFDAIFTGAGSAPLTLRVTATSGTFSLTYTRAGNVGIATGLTTGAWHWIGLRTITGTSVTWMTVDGVPTAVASATPGVTSATIGFSATGSAGWDIYIDDVIVDDAGLLSPSNVTDLLPTADSAIGTGWTLGSGGTTGLWDAVNNQPPTAVADAGTTAQIRNAASATSNYDATLQTYTVGGAASGATVLAVQPIVATGAPVTTSAKLGTVGNVSNPAITNIALGAGGTAGAFWSGVAAGTYPTGWKVSQGTLTTSPTVTLGTAPVMRVTQSTASTRIAMVSYMALRVAWTPGAPPVTGTGAGTGTASTSGGAATETISGTGASTGTAATATGTGSVGSAGATGTGAGTQTTQSASGAGVEAITGSGVGTQVAQSGAGTATLALTGSGAGSQAVQTATGSGVEDISGSGAGSPPPASALGTGLVETPAVTGTGAGIQVAQSAYGEGIGGEVEVPPVIEGSTIFAPKLRVISGSGGGVQARQSAKGRGRVNDDDLVVMAA